MSTATSATYDEARQKYKDESFAGTGKNEATTRELANWAIETGRWTAPMDLQMQKCREDFAAALREEQIRDDGGRLIGRNHGCRIVSEGRQQYRQQYLWIDIRDMPRDKMVSAVQLKREPDSNVVVSRCRVGWFSRCGRRPASGQWVTFMTGTTSRKK